MRFLSGTARPTLIFNPDFQYSCALKCEDIQKSRPYCRCFSTRSVVPSQVGVWKGGVEARAHETGMRLRISDGYRPFIAHRIDLAIYDVSGPTALHCAGMKRNLYRVRPPRGCCTRSRSEYTGCESTADRISIGDSHQRRGSCRVSVHFQEPGQRHFANSDTIAITMN